MLELLGIHKNFGRHKVLTGLDLSLRQGEIYGLLGPNGAGKTTALNIATGLVYPDAGEVRIDGIDLAARPHDCLARVGAQIDEPAFHGHLSGKCNLTLLAALQGTELGQVDTLLAAVGLAARADARAGGYSTGMRQRLGIAAALLGRPRLVILDEPTSGLDPQGREAVIALIRGLAGEYSLTVLFTSHIFDEVARLCDRVGILSGGKLAHEGDVGDPETLREQYFSHTGGREDSL